MVPVCLIPLYYEPLMLGTYTFVLEHVMYIFQSHTLHQSRALLYHHRLHKMATPSNCCTKQPLKHDTTRVVV